MPERAGSPSGLPCPDGEVGVKEVARIASKARRNDRSDRWPSAVSISSNCSHRFLDGGASLCEADQLRPPIVRVRGSLKVATPFEVDDGSDMACW